VLTRRIPALTKVGTEETPVEISTTELLLGALCAANVMIAGVLGLVVARRDRGRPRHRAEPRAQRALHTDPVA